MKMKKFLAVMAVVSMTAAMAAGCGSSEEEGKAETNEKTEASGETDTSFDSANDISVTSREDGSGTRGAFIELLGIEEKDDEGNKNRQYNRRGKYYKQYICYDVNSSRQ